MREADLVRVLRAARMEPVETSSVKAPRNKRRGNHGQRQQDLDGTDEQRLVLVGVGVKGFALKERINNSRRCTGVPEDQLRRLGEHL